MRKRIRYTILMATSAGLLTACVSNTNSMDVSNNKQIPADRHHMQDTMANYDLTVDQQLKMQSIMQERMRGLNLTVDQQVKLQSIMQDGLGDYQQKRGAMLEVLTSEQRQMMLQMHSQSMNSQQIMNNQQMSE